MTGGFPEYLEASLQFSIDTKLLEKMYLVSFRFLLMLIVFHNVFDLRNDISERLNRGKVEMHM